MGIYARCDREIHARCGRGIHAQCGRGIRGTVTGPDVIGESLYASVRKSTHALWHNNPSIRWVENRMWQRAEESTQWMFGRMQLENSLNGCKARCSGGIHLFKTIWHFGLSSFQTCNFSLCCNFDQLINFTSTLYIQPVISLLCNSNQVR